MDSVKPTLDVLVSAIWLRKNDQGEAEVLIEYNQGWHLIMTEHLEGPFSHIMEATGITMEAHIPLYGLPLKKEPVCPSPVPCFPEDDTQS